MSKESHPPANERPTTGSARALFEPIIPDNLERYLKRLDAEMAPKAETQKGE